MSCIITRKSRASIRGKLHRCQTYMRHFSHRRKYTACSSRDSFAYSESRHDSYPQFPRSSLRTRGLQTRSHRQKKKETTAFLESHFAQASSTKNIRESINVWKWRGLSLLGRIQIVRTFPIPKLMFRASVIPVSKELIKAANSVLYNFI